MAKKLNFLALALAAGLTAGGCASTVSQSAEDEWAQPETAGPATVRVSNNSWADINVFLLRGGTRTRLGMVTSMNTSTFRIPDSALQGASDLRLFADPIGVINGWTTQTLLVGAGQQVSLTLQNNLNLSSYSVF